MLRKGGKKSMADTKIIRKMIEPKIEEIQSEFERRPDSKTAEEAEKLYRDLSYLSTDDLLKHFTI